MTQFTLYVKSVMHEAVCDTVHFIFQEGCVRRPSSQNQERRRGGGGGVQSDIIIYTTLLQAKRESAITLDSQYGGGGGRGGSPCLYKGPRGSRPAGIAGDIDRGTRTETSVRDS